MSPKEPFSCYDCSHTRNCSFVSPWHCHTTYHLCMVHVDISCLNPDICVWQLNRLWTCVQFKRDTRPFLSWLAISAQGKRTAQSYGQVYVAKGSMFIGTDYLVRYLAYTLRPGVVFFVFSGISIWSAPVDFWGELGQVFLFRAVGVCGRDLSGKSQRGG